MSKANVVNWFELPVADMDRAKKFYQTVLGTGAFQDMDNEHMKMAAFPWVEGAANAAGALVESAYYKPHNDGLIIYFACEDCATELGRVEAAGGSIMTPKVSIGQFGFVAHFFDTEGNRVGLHSPA